MWVYKAPVCVNCNMSGRRRRKRSNMALIEDRLLKAAADARKAEEAVEDAARQAAAAYDEAVDIATLESLLSLGGMDDDDNMNVFDDIEFPLVEDPYEELEIRARREAREAEEERRRRRYEDMIREEQKRSHK